MTDADRMQRQYESMLRQANEKRLSAIAYVEKVYTQDLRDIEQWVDVEREKLMKRG